MLIVLSWLVTVFTAAALLVRFIETRDMGMAHTKTVSLLFASGVVSPVFVVLLVAYRGVM